MSKIYKISPSCNFLKELAKIIVTEENISKIFVPNNQSINYLKRELAQFDQFIPEIISISQLLEFPDITLMLTKFFKKTTQNVPFSTLYDLSVSLSSIIKELILNKSDYKKLAIPHYLTEYWKHTLLILEEILNCNEILDIRKEFEEKLSNYFFALKNQKILVAGIFELNFYTKSLYQQASKSGIIVLYETEYPKINNLLINSQIINKNNGLALSHSTKFLELRNISDESQAISLAVRKNLFENKTTLIVCPNLDLSEKIKIELLKWNIIPENSFGTPLFKTKLGRILEQIINVIENDFDNESTINLLKFNDLLKPHVMILENFLRKNNVYPRNFFDFWKWFDSCKKSKSTISRKILTPEACNILDDKYDANMPFDASDDDSRKKNFSDDNLTEISEDVYFMQIVHKLKYLATVQNSNSFNFWLKYFQDFVEIIAHELVSDWNNISEKFKNSLNDIELHEFCVFVKKQILKTKMQTKNTFDKVRIVDVWEAQLLDADSIILCSVNENSWKISSQNDFWMNDSMLRQLKISTVQDKNEFYSYIFDILSQKTNVLATRSVTENGEISQICRNLKNKNFGNEIEIKNILNKVQTPTKFTKIEFQKPNPPKNFRPKSFWVTDLDLLINNPYVFYAKKILNLKELNQINELKNLKGNLIHEMLDIATKTSTYDIDKLIQIFHAVVNDNFVDLKSLGLWYFNIDFLLKFFLENFPENVQTYSEIKGSIKFSIDSENFQLSSKADRIDIDNSGNISIIDYKTGEIPSIKKVKSGEKIQLPVEAIIAHQNGFNLGKTKIEKMSFWQLKSKNPKIIDVSNNEIENLKICNEIFEKIKQLIQKYNIFGDGYDINLDDKYNDIYKQLARVKEIYNA